MALGNREDLFDSLFEMLSSENYVEVLMAAEPGMTQSDIANEIGVGSGTVSRAMTELRDYGLIEETEDGYEKVLPSLGHPMIQHFFRTEVLDNE